MSRLHELSPSAVVRLLAVALLVFYCSAILAELNCELSPEALQYQSENPDAIRSGLSIWYGLSKLAWIAGTTLGLAGAILACLPKAFLPKVLENIFLTLSAPLLAGSAYLQSPQSNYPSVEPIHVVLLWCTSSAVWGALVVLMWARDSKILTSPLSDAPR